MNKKIFLFGIVAISLLLVAITMKLFHIPNYSIVIVLGIIVFLFVEIPLYIQHLNRSVLTSKTYTLFTFLFLFSCILSLFFALQDLFIPEKISIIFTIVITIFTILLITRRLTNNLLSLKKISFIHIYIVFLLVMLINLPIQIQAPDYSYHPNIEMPAYERGSGSIICFDEGHNNFHTLEDRLSSTGELLKDDGYKTLSINGDISLDKLKKGKILVIINALNRKNMNWEKPIFSAFTEQEISDISQWVYEGGSLLLIADHMPFPGAINKLVNKFDFNFENGHAKDTIGKPDYFIKKQKTLHDNIITKGRNSNESVDSVLTFSGSAFSIPDDATSILEFDSTWVSYNTNSAWDFNNIKPFSIKEYSQGAFKKFGKGRVVVYGEAMMFTAQLGAGLSWIKMGMNSNKCPQNYQLLLNTIHWLDGLMD